MNAKNAKERNIATETVDEINERMAQFRTYPHLRYVGDNWRAMEFEEQAACRGYMRAGLLHLVDGTLQLSTPEIQS